MKRLISILLALVISMFCATSVFAAESLVEYNNAGEFVFNPTNKDLFQDFKDVMPGDKTEQKIVVKNTKENYPITVYLKAEIDNQYKDFLDQMDIDIYVSDSENGNRVLLQSGRASETGKLTVNTRLGTYRPGESGYITVSLYVHPEMDNDYKDTIGKIKWIFTVEEGDVIHTIPTEPSVTEPDDDSVIIGGNPVTGITLVKAGVAAGVIILAGVCIVFLKKKEKEDNKEEVKNNTNEKESINESINKEEKSEENEA